MKTTKRQARIELNIPSHQKGDNINFPITPNDRVNKYITSYKDVSLNKPTVAKYINTNIINRHA